MIYRIWVAAVMLAASSFAAGIMFGEHEPVLFAVTASAVALNLWTLKIYIDLGMNER